MGKPSLTGRMRMLGLALVAVIAVMGLVASGAFAAPEWKGCVKTEPKNTGKYTDKLCTEESPSTEGKYELVSTVGKGKGFKAKGGATTLHVRIPMSEPPEVTIECTAVKDKGKLALPNLIKEVVIELKGCRFDGGKAPCQSGTKKGVIVTNSLAGEMVDIEGGSGVGSLLEAEASPSAPLATFTCPEILTASIFGSVIAEHTGDVGVISTEAQDHYVVGTGLGEVEYEPAHLYPPLVNIPTHKTGGTTGEHILVSEFTEAGQTEPKGTYPSGLEGVTDEKGEPLMVAP